MSDLRDKLKEEMERLKTARDELKVQLHLGKAEIKEQWDKLEKAWEHAEAKLKVLRDESADSAEDIGSAAKLLVDQIKEGYQHLRSLV